LAETDDGAEQEPSQAGEETARAGQIVLQKTSTKNFSTLDNTQGEND